MFKVVIKNTRTGKIYEHVVSARPTTGNPAAAVAVRTVRTQIMKKYKGRRDDYQALSAKEV